MSKPRHRCFELLAKEALLLAIGRDYFGRAFVKILGITVDEVCKTTKEERPFNLLPGARITGIGSEGQDFVVLCIPKLLQALKLTRHVLFGNYTPNGFFKLSIFVCGRVQPLRICRDRAVAQYADFFKVIFGVSAFHPQVLFDCVNVLSFKVFGKRTIRLVDESLCVGSATQRGQSSDHCVLELLTRGGVARIAFPSEHGDCRGSFFFVCVLSTLCEKELCRWVRVDYKAVFSRIQYLPRRRTRSRPHRGPCGLGELSRVQHCPEHVGKIALLGRVKLYKSVEFCFRRSFPICHKRTKVFGSWKQPERLA